MPINPTNGVLEPVGDDKEIHDFFGTVVIDAFREYFSDGKGKHAISIYSFMLASSGIFAAQLQVIELFLRNNAYKDQETKEILIEGYLRMANEIGKILGLSKEDMARLRMEQNECAVTVSVK